MTCWQPAAPTISNDYTEIQNALLYDREDRDRILINIAERRDRQRGRGIVYVPLKNIEEGAGGDTYDRYGII